MLKRTNNFLDYTATHLDTILTYTACDMVLEVHSDTSYLSKTKERIRAQGNLLLEGDTRNTTDNGAVLNIDQIIKAVMTSASEAGLGARFINTRYVVPQKN